MKQYKHSSYSYVSIVQIDKSEVDHFDFAACKEPRETLGSFYNRQKTKPDVLCNAGFFAMSNGTPCFNLIDEGVVRSNNANYRTGMGTAVGKANELLFGTLDSGIKWKDFISAYPVLLEGKGAISKFTVGSEINYKATRTCIGFNDSSVFVIHIGKPGMNFQTMSTMLNNMGVKYAINLDGGGSARLMVKGKVYGTPTENRSVDNVFCVYLKKNTTPATDDSSKSDNTIAADTPYVYYTVVKGDSWWGIAAKKLGDGTKYKELMAFNGVTSSNLYAGMKIKIPAKEITYTVVKGDSWWGIAAKQMGSGTRYKELCAYNNMTPNTTIYPGMKIKIPV